MYNQRPGSFRGDDRIDLVGPNRMLERSRSRAQDHFTGSEEAMRSEEVAAEAAAERRDAARRAREEMSESLGARLHGWWFRHFHQSYFRRMRQSQHDG